MVHAPVTSGYLLSAAPMALGEVRPRQNSSTYASVVQPRADGSTVTVNPVIAPDARSRSTRRLTADADNPTVAPISA